MSTGDFDRISGIDLHLKIASSPLHAAGRRDDRKEMLGGLSWKKGILILARAMPNLSLAESILT